MNMTLGAFIKALEKVNPDVPVYYDWAMLRPTHFASYRGYYEDLALGVTTESDATAGDLLAFAKAALGATFYGWKGGEYPMTAGTPLWVANQGKVGDTKIVGVLDEGHVVIIETMIATEDD